MDRSGGGGYGEGVSADTSHYDNASSMQAAHYEAYGDAKSDGSTLSRDSVNWNAFWRKYVLIAGRMDYDGNNAPSKFGDLLLRVSSHHRSVERMPHRRDPQRDKDLVLHPTSAAPWLDTGLYIEQMAATECSGDRLTCINLI